MKIIKKHSPNIYLTLIIIGIIVLIIPEFFSYSNDLIIIFILLPVLFKKK